MPDSRGFGLIIETGSGPVSTRTGALIVETAAAGASATITATLGALTFAGSSHVSPAAAVAATIGALTFAGSSSSGTATDAISATIADLAFAGSSAGAGTITMLGFAELTTGADRVGDTGITVCVNHRTTGELVVQLTGQTSDGAGVCAISDPALVAGTAYRVYQEFPDGTIGCWIYTAT